jgi:hypothetical protein
MSHCRESLVYNIVGVVCVGQHITGVLMNRSYIFSTRLVWQSPRVFRPFSGRRCYYIDDKSKADGPASFHSILIYLHGTVTKRRVGGGKKMLFNIVGRAVKNQTKRNSTSSNGVIGQINEDLQDFSNCYIIPIVNCSKIRWAMSKQKCVLSCSNLQSVSGIFLFIF